MPLTIADCDKARWLLYGLAILHEAVVPELEALDSPNADGLGISHVEDVAGDRDIPRVRSSILAPVRPHRHKAGVVRTPKGVLRDLHIPQSCAILPRRKVETQTMDPAAGAIQRVALDDHVLSPGEEGIAHVGRDGVIADHGGFRVVIEVHHLCLAGNETLHLLVESHPVRPVLWVERIGGDRPHAKHLLCRRVEELKAVAFPNRVVVVAVVGAS